MRIVQDAELTSPAKLAEIIREAGERGVRFQPSGVEIPAGTAAVAEGVMSLVSLARRAELRSQIRRAIRSRGGQWGASRFAKLTLDQCKEVSEARQRGEEYESLARRMGVSVGCIQRSIKRAEKHRLLA